MKAWDEVLSRLGHLNKICPNPKDAEPQETPSSRKRPSSNEPDEISQKRRPQNEDQSIQFRPESENRQNLNMSKTSTKPCQSPSTSRPSPVPQKRTPSIQESNDQTSEELPHSNNYLLSLQKQQQNYQPKNMLGQKQQYEPKNNNMAQNRQ